MNTAIKTMYKTFLAAALLAGFTANAQKKTITVTQLPAAAQTFIKTHFAGQNADYIVEDKGLLDTDYEVRLANGTEIEFDEKGNWDEIDGNRNILPTAIIPKGIATYTTANYKGHNVVKIDKKRSGYEVELSNGVELEFDTAGKFLRLDD